MVSTLNPGWPCVLQLLGMGSRQSPGQQRHTLTLFCIGWIFTWQLREIASNMVQLQRALNDLSEEHNSAMSQSQEKQQQLEKELHAALQDKVRGPRAGWVPPCSSPMPLQLGDMPTASRVQQPGASCPSVPAHREKLCSCQLLWEVSLFLGRVSYAGAGCCPCSGERQSCWKSMVSVLTGWLCRSLVGWLFSLAPCSVPFLSPEMLRRENRDSTGKDFYAGGPAVQAGGVQHSGEGRSHG